MNSVHRIQLHIADPSARVGRRARNLCMREAFLLQGRRDRAQAVAESAQDGTKGWPAQLDRVGDRETRAIHGSSAEGQCGRVPGGGPL